MTNKQIYTQDSIWTMDNISDFIEYHNSQHVNYCEIIIDSDCSIQYAIPSHQLKLMELYGVPKYQIDDQEGEEYRELINTMPTYASPNHWLCDYINAVIVWYGHVILPYNYKNEQIDCINTLIDNHVLSDSISVDISKEYHHLLITEDDDKYDTDNKIKYIKALIDEANKRLEKAKSELHIKSLGN
jgi:hypothetical protein